MASLPDPVDGHEPTIVRLPAGWILSCSCGELGRAVEGVPAGVMLTGSSRERRSAASFAWRRHTVPADDRVSTT